MIRKFVLTIAFAIVFTFVSTLSSAQDTTPLTIVCPANITVSNVPGQSSAIVNYAVTATDNCPEGVVVSCSPPSGSTFPKGTTTVTCTARDASGNTASCSFTVTVTVIDNTPPPPAFSITPIKSSFPGQPFITCLQGQFEPTPPLFTLSPPHFWFIHPQQSG